MTASKPYTWWTAEDEAEAARVLVEARETLPDRVRGAHAIRWPGGDDQRRRHDAAVARLYPYVYKFAHGACVTRRRAQEYDWADLPTIVTDDLIASGHVYAWDPSRGSIYTFFSMACNRSIAARYRRIYGSDVYRTTPSMDVVYSLEGLPDDLVETMAVDCLLERIELAEEVMTLARQTPMVPAWWRDSVFVPAMREWLCSMVADRWVMHDMGDDAGQPPLTPTMMASKSWRSEALVTVYTRAAMRPILHALHLTHTEVPDGKTNH